MLIDTDPPRHHADAGATRSSRSASRPSRFTGLESASGLAGEVARRPARAQAAGRRGARSSSSSSTSASRSSPSRALPVVGNATVAGAQLPRRADARRSPRRSTTTWLADALKYTIAAAAAATLIAAANSADAGPLAAGLLAVDQPPDPQRRSGRLHPTPVDARTWSSRSPPCSPPASSSRATSSFLVGIFAFGATAGVHDRPPVGDRPALPRARPRPPVPDPAVSVRVRGGDAAAARGARRASLAPAAWVACSCPTRARAASAPRWMAVRARALRHLPHDAGQAALRAGDHPRGGAAREREEAEYGSILVPIFGTPLDDDIVQTAGRLAAEEDDDEGEGGAR